MTLYSLRIKTAEKISRNLSTHHNLSVNRCTVFNQVSTVLFIIIYSKFYEIIWVNDL